MIAEDNLPRCDGNFMTRPKMVGAHWCMATNRAFPVFQQMAGTTQQILPTLP